MSRRRVIIRCRDCWKDLYIALEGDELKKCDFCRKDSTYEHAYDPSKKKSKQKKD